MSGSEPFFNTSVLLYLLSAEGEKADRVETLLADFGVISVQVLNEFTAVATRKLAMPLADVREVLEYAGSVASNPSPSTITNSPARSWNATNSPFMIR